MVGKAFPGRAAIRVKLLELDETMLTAVYEKPGSMKIGGMERYFLRLKGRFEPIYRSAGCTNRNQHAVAGRPNLVALLAMMSFG
jgi:hypothetical protein